MSYAALFDELKAADGPARPAAGISLSEEQAAALEGSVRHSAAICAGAGAGKTRLLVERAAKLVSMGVDPATIAVVTFTRKAASEISHRLQTRFGARARVPACATVHALALSLLRSQGLETRVASDEEVLVLLQRIRQDLPEDYTGLTDAELLLELNRCREEQAYTTTLGLYAYALEELLAERGLTDFTALVDAATRTAAPRYRHILVDEAQDLSRLQRQFLRRIGLSDCRYWYIGDADQSIYAFRGSQGSVMQELVAECDEQHLLSVNYRSTRAVVRHANNVIQFNPGRLAISWRPNRTEEGTVGVRHFEHGDKEREAVRAWLLGSPKRVALARVQALVEPLRSEGLRVHSVHESKGLEWDEVWVMGCEAALFPHPLADREEERRLFYVAMTRARDHLVMSYCASRSSKNPLQASRHPSPFLFETQALEG